MENINTILKLNALSCLLFGALFVFMPETIIAFLADTNHMPKLVLVALGVVLNLWGMLLVWLSNRDPLPNVVLLIVALGDFFWVAATVVLLLMQVWVNSSNGIVAAGLIAMLVGWFGWLQLHYYLDNK